MKAFKLTVKGTYKTIEKKLKSFNYEFVVPNPNIGQAKYFANRLLVAKIKEDQIIDFDYIYKVYITKSEPVEYKGDLIGRSIQDLTEYEVQELAAMHNLKKVPYFESEGLDEIKKRAVIEYAKVIKPDVDAQLIEDDFMKKHVLELPKIKIGQAKVAVVKQEDKISALDMFDDVSEVDRDVDLEEPADDVSETEKLFDEVPQESNSGMTKEELIDALKGLGIGGIHPNTSLEKLQSRYDEAIKNIS